VAGRALLDTSAAAAYSSNPAFNLERVTRFAEVIVVIPCDEGTADVYARVKQTLRSKGRPIPDNDLWIAATSIQHGLRLINRDAHFEQIDELERETW